MMAGGGDVAARMIPLIDCAETLPHIGSISEQKGVLIHKLPTINSLQRPLLILLGGTSTNVVYLIGLGLLITVTVWILSTLVDRILRKLVKGKRMKEETARELRKTVSDATRRLNIISESESMRRPSSDKWSRKQILGHMIDSASNNHQRFIRGQMSSEIRMGGYEQDRWVTCQDYQNENWLDMVQLWSFYNLHLAHVITCVPEASLKNICFVGENEPVTLEFLIQDYLRHLKHHIDQLLAGW